MPAEAPTRRKKPRKAADPKSPTVAPAPTMTITLVLSPGVSASEGPNSFVPAPQPQTTGATASISLAVAATTPAAPVAPTPDPVSGTSLPAPAVDDFPEQALAANERSEPVTAASEPSRSAVVPEDDTRAEMRPEPADAMPCDHAVKTLHPLLEKGARELIAFGLYPDVAALLDEAVYRLLESDYPADPGG